MTFPNANGPMPSCDFRVLLSELASLSRLDALEVMAVWEGREQAGRDPNGRAALCREVLEHVRTGVYR